MSVVVTGAVCRVLGAPAELVVSPAAAVEPAATEPVPA
jgi:hypothetical protein